MYALPFFTERKDKYSAHKGRLFLMSAVATRELYAHTPQISYMLIAALFGYGKIFTGLSLL
jgi:hypothetical protein